jgi:multiple antibiotic resistance protein
MNEFYTQIITVFLGFFAIMNPLANTAVFAGLVGNRTHAEQVKIATKALITTFFVICAFALLGKAIFHLFGITLPALRITGGVLVFIIGYHMLNGNSSKLHSPQQNTDSDMAISPLAVPLLAGPGTIATAMNYSSSGNIADIIVVIAVFALLCVVTFLCFIYSAKVLTLLGEGGLTIVTRLMGLILAVIGTQMLITGVSSLLKAPLNI